MKPTYKQRKTKLFEQLGVDKCAICGYSVTHLLNFHHILPWTKTAKVTTYVLRNQMKRAYDEALKCIPLCGKCHAEADAGYWNPSFLQHITVYKQEE